MITSKPAVHEHYHENNMSMQPWEMHGTPPPMVSPCLSGIVRLWQPLKGYPDIKWRSGYSYKPSMTEVPKGRTRMLYILRNQETLVHPDRHRWTFHLYNSGDLERHQML